MSDQKYIPKRIHYIWFGRGEKSDLIKTCLSKNKEILQDWKFNEWNEDNYDINSCNYVRDAYKAKKYAFASDYARFDILYKNGGVYLDTDVEMIKKIPDSFLENEGFTGVESNNKIAPGLVFACKPGNPIVLEILEDYKKDSFILDDGSYNFETVVDRVTRIFNKHGFCLNGEKQVIDGFVIYPCEYFCAYDFVMSEFTITDKTISIHHYTATWVSFGSKIKKCIQKLIRSVFGKEIYLKLIYFKRKVWGENE